MKVRDSGMPEEQYWESLFDVDLILDRLEIDERIGDAVELGCGYGTFTVPVAQRISGTLRTVDVEADMLARTETRVHAAGLTNVECVSRDVVKNGFGVPPHSMDCCLLFNILHGENPVSLLRHAADTLTKSGTICVIHWRYNNDTPRGPDLSIRPKPEQIAAWAAETGLLQLHGPSIDLPPWHFGLRLRHS